MIQRVNGDWKTQVHDACAGGDLDTLRRYVTSQNVETPVATFSHNGEDAMPPLACCCYYNRLQCVRWLVEDVGANIHGTPLFWACSRNANDCISYLLRHGASPNTVHPRAGLSVLHVSAMRNTVAVTRLLAAKADVHACGDVNETPLELALKAANHWGHHEPDHFSAIRNAQCLIYAGARLSDVHDQTLVTRDMTLYQARKELKRHNCIAATLALYRVMRQHGCPKDLTQHVCRTLVMPTWRRQQWAPELQRGVVHTLKWVVYKVVDFLFGVATGLCFLYLCCREK